MISFLLCKKYFTASLHQKMPPKEFKHRVQWVEGGIGWGLLAAVFRWCDTSGEIICQKICEKLTDKKDRNAWLRVWNGSSVMRRNRCWLKGESSDLGREVTVQGFLAKVGKSSFQMRYSIRDEMGDELAIMETTSVHVDKETLSKPTPLPCPDTLRECIEDNVPIILNKWAVPESEPIKTLKSNITIRISDCDSLGHINNAVYPLLAMEAIPSNVSTSFSFCDVDYVGQAYAKDVLNTISNQYADGTIRVCLQAQDGSVITNVTFFPRGSTPRL